MRWLNVARSEHDQPVMHVVFHVMYPCFILDKILGSEALRQGDVVGWSFGIGFVEMPLGLLVGILAARLLRLERGKGLRTFAFAVAIQNFGYTAIPMVQALWGAAAVSVLMVHNLGVELSIWTLGVMWISSDSKVPWRKLINGPALSVVLGLCLVAFGWDQHVTGPVRESMKMLGAGAFPLAITLTGAMMWDMIRIERLSPRMVIGSCVVRLLCLPLVLLCLAKFLPLALPLQQVLVVQAAMPAAMSPLLLASLYGGRPGIAAQVIVATTTVSLLTLPWIITLGQHWLWR